VRRRIQGVWLGRRRYEPTYRLQRALFAMRRAGRGEDVVLWTEHEPVITFGRGGHRRHLLASPDSLASRGIEVVETDRGGDVTLHAPGQLVCYPILGLCPDRQNVRQYVRDLAETMRGIVRAWGIAAGTVDGLVGLWVDARRPDRWSGAKGSTDLAKIGAIGVRLSRWVTMHGFALNLTTDLDLFSLIVPCGISEHRVTSLHQLTGHSPDPREAAECGLERLAEVFDADCATLTDSSHQSLDRVAAWAGA
jgi:lipoyl(octanoyl) transferase